MCLLKCTHYKRFKLQSRLQPNGKQPRKVLWHRRIIRLRRLYCPSRSLRVRVNTKTNSNEIGFCVCTRGIKKTKWNIIIYFWWAQIAANKVWLLLLYLRLMSNKSQTTFNLKLSPAGTKGPSAGWRPVGKKERHFQKGYRFWNFFKHKKDSKK